MSDDYPPGTNACCCTCVKCRVRYRPPADISPFRDNPRALWVAWVRLAGGMDPIRGIAGPWRVRGRHGVESRAEVLGFDASTDGLMGHTVRSDGWGVGTLASGSETGDEAKRRVDQHLLRVGVALLDPDGTLRAEVPDGTVVPR